jgi:hypothetical protein
MVSRLGEISAIQEFPEPGLKFPFCRGVIQNTVSANVMEDFHGSGSNLRGAQGFVIKRMRKFL